MTTLKAPLVEESDEEEESLSPRDIRKAPNKITNKTRGRRDDVTMETRPATRESCDVAVETREMAKVTLECGSQVGGYDADVQTHISADFWDDLDKVC